MVESKALGIGCVASTSCESGRASLNEKSIMIRMKMEHSYRLDERPRVDMAKWRPRSYMVRVGQCRLLQMIGGSIRIIFNRHSEQDNCRRQLSTGYGKDITKPPLGFNVHYECRERILSDFACPKKVKSMNIVD